MTCNKQQSFVWPDEVRWLILKAVAVAAVVVGVVATPVTLWLDIVSFLEHFVFVFVSVALHLCVCRVKKKEEEEHPTSHSI